MKNPFNKTKSKLDEIIDKLLEEIADLDPDDPDYSTKMDQLERLKKLQAGEPRGGVSNDTLVIVLGNIVVVLIIVAFEQKHVMVSKALNYIQKFKT